MKKTYMTTWFLFILSIACVALVVSAQDAGIEDLMNEMKAPGGTNVAMADPVPVEPSVAVTPVESAVAPAVSEPTVGVAEEVKAEVAPVEVPVTGETKVETPVVEDKPVGETVPQVAVPQSSEVAVPSEQPAVDVAPAVAPSTTVKTTTEGRDQIANVLAQQEEVRRQAREVEGRKSLESADKAWKAGEYSQALTQYRNAVSKLPATPAMASMRSRAIARIPECEYQEVLALVKTGKNDLALSRGKELLAQNPDNSALRKLVAKIEAEKSRAVEQSKSEKVTGKTAEVSEVRKQLLLGKKAYADKNYELARSSFESVLALEPQNSQAIGYLKELGNREYAVNSSERDATAAKMSAQVRNTWNPPYKVIKTKAEQEVKPKLPTAIPLVEKMEKIVIPEIEFRQANIHDVVGFLNKAAIDGDKSTDDPAKRGVNIILNLNPSGVSAAPRAAPAADDPFGSAAPSGGSSGSSVYEITFQARYITLMNTLKIITEVAGLKYRIESDIVMIVPADYDPAKIEIKMYPVEPTFITRVQETGAALPPAGRTIGGREVTTMGAGELLSTGIPDLKNTFVQMGVPFPAGASITYNSAIGKVIVANTADNLATFERLLAELNVVPKQVEIEARFVEVNETDLMETGLEWLLTDAWEIASKGGAGAQRIQMNQNIAQGGMTTGMRFWGTGSDNADTPLAAGKGNMGAVASISSVLTNPELTMVLHLLQQNGNADLLSAPKVTTRSGNEASIRVVTEYIYPTAFEVDGGQINAGGNAGDADIVQETTVTPQDFATREVGVLLTVLPEVSPDGNMINLTMQPQVVTEPTWYQYGSTVRRADGSEVTLNMPQPFFKVRSLNTQISIYDGATVVMGGLITEELIKVNDQIPVLGDIPLLGALFRVKSEKSVKKNLLIFVTAKLVDPAGRLIRQPDGDDKSKPTALAPVAN